MCKVIERPDSSSEPSSRFSRPQWIAWYVCTLLILVRLPAPGWAHGSGPDKQRVLTTVAQIRALSAAQAREKLPIHLTGVITYRAPDYQVTFFQDATAGIFVWVEQQDLAITAGSLVEVNGNTTAGDFAPSIEHARIHPLGSAALPSPAPKTLEVLLTGSEDSQWVEVKGIVHSVALEDRLPPDMRKGPPQLVIGIASGSNKFKARIREFPHDVDYKHLIDSVVTVHGACGTLFNERRQLIGVQLFVPSLAQLNVNDAAPPDPYALSTVPIDSLMQFTRAKTTGRRMHIRGVVTLRQTGRIFLQDASGGVAVESEPTASVHPGDLVHAVGFPSAGRYAPILQDGGFRKIGTSSVPAPVDLTAATGLCGGHDAERVRINGILLGQSEQGDYLLITLQKGKSTFTGRLAKQAVTNSVRGLRDGSELQLSGVWSVETDEYHRPTAYQVLLQSENDLEVVTAATWWTAERIFALLSALAGVIVLGSLWVAALRRRVKEQTAMLRATLESTADGILVLNSEGLIATCNQKFAEMWHIPETLLHSNDEAMIFQSMAGLLKDSAGFLSSVRELSVDKGGQQDDVIEAKDGRVFERHSEAQNMNQKRVGWVWGFRDVTERRRAQERIVAHAAELDIANQEIGRLNEQLKSENSRMSLELEITKRLQRMMLPRDNDLRHIKHLDISGFMESASEVGGDYYDVFSSNGRVIFGIGDVTGHGLESGVMAIMVQTAVRTLLASGLYENHKLFEILNRVVYSNAQQMNCDRNVTLSLLQYQDGFVTVSGQHEEVIVVRQDGTVERHDTLDLGFALGLEENISGLVAEERIALRSGDVMILYTDGVTEAINSAGVGYGIERLAEAAKHSHHEPAAAIRDKVLSSLRGHMNGEDLLDDITVLVVKPV
jgi:PAS domain S-box-containing protein